jgi:hypothetical protein
MSPPSPAGRILPVASDIYVAAHQVGPHVSLNGGPYMAVKEVPHASEHTGKLDHTRRVTMIADVR